MNNIGKYDLDIETITPIHIGSGDIYLASELILDDERYNRINLSKYFKQLDKNQQNKLIDDLIEKKMLLEDIDEEFIRYPLSKMFDDDFKNDNDIHENIKVFNKPYIPGSSIKGAIRTALLYNLFKIEDLNKIFIDGKINESLLNSYFSENDTNIDILRFLKIKDSTTIPQPLLYKVFNKKPETKGGFDKGIPVYLESIYSTDKLSSSLINTYEYGDFDILNFDNDKLKMLNIDYIKESIYKFSGDLIKHEIQFCKDNKLHDLQKFYESLDNSLDAPLLRLGHGSGFLATTLGLKIKNNDEKLYNKIKTLIKGSNNNKKNNKKTMDDFPLTRLIIKKNQDKPIGWVKVSFKENVVY